jgi:tRNA nucleotidyltransferase/poly(A) polymerase
MTAIDFMSIMVELLNLLKGSRFEGHVFAVGGSVRDLVMQSEIKDIDLVVDIPNGGIDLALYLDGLGCLTHKPVTYPTYGTCMFSLKKFPDVELEAVHTRGEQYHDKNSRNPETFFAGIDADSIRRDLTINALYYDIFKSGIVDPTGKGMYDIAHRVIRTSNTNPNIVFDDDPLRILRVIRFSVKYGWEIENRTKEAMELYADRLSIISRERITQEFVKMLNTKYPGNAMRLINELGLWEVVMGFELPEDCGYKISQALDECARCNYSLYTRLAVVFNGLSGDDCRSTLLSLKFSSKDSNHVSKIVSHLRAFGGGYNNAFIRKVQLEFSRECFIELLNAIDVLGLCYDTNDIRRRVWNGECNMFGYKLPVSGDDVIELLGVEPGVEVGRILSDMIDLACKNPDIGKEELIDFFRERLWQY